MDSAVPVSHDPVAGQAQTSSLSSGPHRSGTVSVGGGGACFGGVEAGQTLRCPGGGAAAAPSAPGCAAQWARLTFSAGQGEARPATRAQGTGQRRVDRTCLTRGAAPACPSGSSSLHIRPRPECGRGGGAGRGRGAYRGGAGRENVITRSSLLKVRHRLAGNRVHGGRGSCGAGAGPEGRPRPSHGRCQEPPTPRTGGYRQIQHGAPRFSPSQPPAEEAGRGESRPRLSGWTCLPSGPLPGASHRRVQPLARRPRTLVPRPRPHSDAPTRPTVLPTKPAPPSSLRPEPPHTTSLAPAARTRPLSPQRGWTDRCMDGHSDRLSTFAKS